MYLRLVSEIGFDSLYVFLRCKGDIDWKLKLKVDIDWTLTLKTLLETQKWGRRANHTYGQAELDEVRNEIANYVMKNLLKL
ncbi:hypothetical protein ABKV19_017710 [Rosa sericea]